MQKFLFFIFFTIALSNNPNLPEHILPIYGNASMGYYFVKIFVGHPPQQQSVIIDTGSGQLALPCNKCTNCNPNHIDKPFNMQKSKTAQYLTCESTDMQCRRCPSKNPTESCKFTISYAEGSSLEGIIIKDSIQFESFSEGQQIITSFGCTTRETNLFLKQEANGIFGLSPDRTSSLLEDLYAKHHGYSGQQLQFSLCLSGNGGLMTVGKINQTLHSSSESIKTSFSTFRNLYSLNDVGEIKIGTSLIHKKDEKFGLYGIFIDSGSTFTYFPHQNYLVFKNELIKRCSQHQSLCEAAEGQTTLCFHLKGSKDILESMNQIFPPIQFDIASKNLTWSPQKYFLLRDKTNRQICLGVQSLDRYLLGANWMVDRDIVFNLKQKTVQIFSEANCMQKQSPRRYMSQYSQEVDGHQPLKYQSGEGLKFDSNVWIVIGILLIVIGAAGLFIILLSQCEKKKQKKHNPVSTIETQDHVELSASSSRDKNESQM